MKIGELAKLASTPVETIRFYEREALLPPAERTDANYRIYTPAHAERLAFIRHCRTLDMTLDEIRVLLRLRDAPQENCTEVNQLLDEHIEHVAHRMRELKALEQQLKTLRQQCTEGHAARDCGILNRLTEEARSTPPGPRKRLHVHGSHG